MTGQFKDNNEITKHGTMEYVMTHIAPYFYKGLSFDDSFSRANGNAILAARAFRIIDHGKVIDHGDCLLRTFFCA